MIIMVVTSMLAAATILWLQGRFEHADERNALGIVQAYRSPAGVTLPALLSHQHPGRPVQWSTHTRSSCFQHISVNASVSDHPGTEPTVYSFAVDLNGPSIHPANEPGARLLGMMNTPLPPSSASVAGSSSAAAGSVSAAGSASAAAASASSGAAPAASASSAAGAGQPQEHAP